MSDITERIKALSPERRELLETLLMERSKNFAPERVIPRRQGDGLIPLSFAQERLWFLSQLEPDSPFYNVHEAVRLTGSLLVPAFKRTMKEVVRRHEVLRTTVRTIDGEPMQVIAPELDVALPEIDISVLPQVERDSEMRRLINAEARRPFDLAKGPLIRTTLLRLAAEDYLCLLTMHHIISDAWSLGVLMREVATLYAAFSAGLPSPLPELPIQYADFASWQKQLLGGEMFAAQSKYWKERLKDLPQVLQLPIDHPRPPVQSFSGATLKVAVPLSLSEELKELSRAETVTLFMTLLAALQTLLYRYTGDPDVVVGSPIANRTLQETEALIGFFANTLVLRADMSGDPSFREVLRRTRESTLEAYAHQDFPFEKLVDELQPERSLSYTPLFQVVFALQNAPAEALHLPGLQLTSVPVETETAKFDITLMMAETKAGLMGKLEFNTDLFSEEFRERFLRNFLVLLQAVVAHPNHSISTLPLLDEQESCRLVRSLNDTSAEYARERCIGDLFAEQAKRTPLAVALMSEEEQVSYADLDGRANRLARYLRGRGVRPEARVGILMERSVEMVVAVLAVLKAGGAYVPLDPKYPAQRIEMMAKDAELALVLGNSEEAARLGWLGRSNVVLVDLERAQIEAQSSEGIAQEMSSLSAAYVIYTSGSTGDPKGVIGLHRGAVNRFEWMWKAYPFEPGEICCQKTSLNFLDSLWEIFGPLLQGVPAVIISDETIKDPARLVAVLADNRVTRIVLVPSLLRVILDSGIDLQNRLPALKWWVTSGEALPVELLGRFRESIPDAKLLNLYGSSEVSADATWFDTSGGSASTSVPIGGPIANTQIYLLDAHLQPVPVGMPGELYIGGDGLSRGYHNLPAMTAERFLPNPFSSEPGARLYRPGDIARYLPDGNIEYLGRRDAQVKVRGFRIELGEIETLLEKHEQVHQAIVIVREDRPGDKRLVAYTVTDAAVALKVNELRDFLRQRLPDYMIPAAFVNLRELPLTPSGKVDRKALPSVDGARPELGRFIPPRNPVEQILADTWAQVLRLQKVGVHDNFFELGGDSILSIQLAAKAERAGLRFTPKQVFQHQTIAGLAKVLGSTSVTQASQRPVTGDVSLTPIQHWFFELSLSEPHHFNQAVMLEARSDIDEATMERSITLLLQHHDALRLRFTRGQAGWQQFNNLPDDAVPFSRVDISSLDEDDQLAAIEAEGRKLHTSLDISEGPLLRVGLFAMGANRSPQLLIIIHHLVVDGVSWRILLSDLESVYEQIRRGATAPQLPARTTSYQQWAATLEEYAQSTQARQEASYWLRTVQPVNTLPRDEGGENTGDSSRRVTISLTTEETRLLLQEVPKAYRTQINDALLTALAEALQHATGNPCVLVDLEGHGREEEVVSGVDLSRTVGWFTSIFPVHLDLRESGRRNGESWECGAALKSVKEQLRRVPRRGIGYGVLRYLSGDAELVAQLKSQPQAEVSFNYLGQLDVVLSESSLFRLLPKGGGEAASTRRTRPYVLEVTGYVSGGQLFLEWVYSENLHRRETIERLAENYMKALRSLIDHCLSPDVGGCTPSDFPDSMLNQEELDSFLSRIGSML